MENQVIIIGSGAAGLSTALEFAKNGIKSLLVSDMPAVRSQSVMAQGGINASSYGTDPGTFGDSPDRHAEETLRSGRHLADPDAVLDMAKAAPNIIEELFDAGMSFSLRDGKPDVRAFGGQSVKRTFYAASDTGKQLMHTLIDQARRYEALGKIEVLSGWEFCRLIEKENVCYGCELSRMITGERRHVFGKVVIATGGLNGIFGNATGSVKNTGLASAGIFAAGVEFANLEFIQYHPTTVKLHGKNMLITEAARGEGGRLLVIRDGKPFYFMEEKYPELGSLMPRDVISREEWDLISHGENIYLDMRNLGKDVFEKKLKSLVDDCKKFLAVDPMRELIPVAPGIHYFMGGIKVDRQHRTSMKNLYAAGECACQYHGANRLGGNSLLGAIYGGKVAAKAVMSDSVGEKNATALESTLDDIYGNDASLGEIDLAEQTTAEDHVDSCNLDELQKIMRKALGIVREKSALEEALVETDRLITVENSHTAFYNLLLLSKAMLISALERKESRGAHTRSDYPEENLDYQKESRVRFEKGKIELNFREAGER